MKKAKYGIKFPYSRQGIPKIRKFSPAKIFTSCSGGKNKHTKIFPRSAISVRNYAYVCEYRIKIAPYTGFHLKCRIANSSH